MTHSRLPLLVFAFALSATPAGKFALTIDNIMRGPGLVGYEPSQVRWSGDSQRIYFQWKQSTDKVRRAARHLRSQPRRLRPAQALRRGSEARPARLRRRQPIDKDSATVYVRDGDIFVYDTTTGQTRQITKTTDIESEPALHCRTASASASRAPTICTSISLDTGALGSD